MANEATAAAGANKNGVFSLGHLPLFQMKNETTGQAKISAGIFHQLPGRPFRTDSQITNQIPVARYAASNIWPIINAPIRR